MLDQAIETAFDQHWLVLLPTENLLLRKLCEGREGYFAAATLEQTLRGVSGPSFQTMIRY